MVVMSRIVSPRRLAAILCLLLCFFRTGPQLQAGPAPWQTLHDCRLIKKETHDGDSFHVRHQGKEYIFRLYYVDTPETKEMDLTKRTTEQARYWKIYKKDLYLLAGLAADFTSETLSRPFTVTTCWEDAKGNSTLPRYYAVIRDANQKDLAGLLVSNGLARIYGLPVTSPEGTSGKQVQETLKKLELEAQKQNKGAWALPKKK
jgi:endonuclease YncB( thermonuclease family)